MGIFGFGRKKEVASAGACGDKRATIETKEPEATVKILGSGCDKCNALEAATVEALRELGRDTRVEHVRDFAKIAAFGVMQTPALVVGGKVVSYGRVLSKEAVKKLLR
jgi:small redox-active disulfide protein 2